MDQARSQPGRLRPSPQSTGSVRYLDSHSRHSHGLLANCATHHLLWLEYLTQLIISSLGRPCAKSVFCLNAEVPPELCPKWQLQPGVDITPKSKRPSACFPPIEAGGIHILFWVLQKGRTYQSPPIGFVQKYVKLGQLGSLWPSGRPVGHSSGWVVGIPRASLLPEGHTGAQGKKKFGWGNEHLIKVLLHLR